MASAAQPAYSSNITECVRHAGSGCVECMLKRTIYDDHKRPGPYYAEAASIPATAAAGSAAAAEVALPAITPSGSTEDVEVARVLAAGARAPSQQPPSTAAAVREAPAAAVAGSPPGYVPHTKQYSGGYGPHSGQYGGGYDGSHTPHEQGPGYEPHPHNDYYGSHAPLKPDYGGHDSYSPPGFHPYQGYDSYPTDGYDSYGRCVACLGVGLALAVALCTCMPVGVQPLAPAADVLCAFGCEGGGGGGGGDKACRPESAGVSNMCLAAVCVCMSAAHASCFCR